MSHILIIFNWRIAQERRRLSRIHISKRIQLLIFRTNRVIPSSFTLRRPFRQKHRKRHRVLLIHMVMYQELPKSVHIMRNRLKVLNSLNLVSQLDDADLSIDVVAVAGYPNLSKLGVENVDEGSWVKLAVLDEVPDLFFDIVPVHSERDHQMSCVFVEYRNFSQIVFLMPILNNVQRMNLTSIEPLEVSACRYSQLVRPV